MASSLTMTVYTRLAAEEAIYARAVYPLPIPASVLPQEFRGMDRAFVLAGIPLGLLIPIKDYM